MSTTTRVTWRDVLSVLAARALPRRSDYAGLRHGWRGDLPNLYGTRMEYRWKF